MQIIGHGIDIVSFARTDKHLRAESGDWVESIFTAEEQSQADPPPNRIAFYSGRYAAKEAVAKALGTGFSDVSWRDVEIYRTVTGAVEIRLSLGALHVATSLGVTRWFVSISHTGEYAMASAIAVTE